MFTGSVTFGTNDPNENPFDFSLSGSVDAPAARIIDDGSAGYSPGGFLAGPKVEGFGGDVDYTPAHATRAATWTFSNLDPGTYQVAATWSPAYNRATTAPYHINGGSAITVNQRAHPRDFLADGARWEVLGEAEVGTGGDPIVVTLNANGVNGLVIADAVRIVAVSERALDRPGEFAVIDNGEPGFGGDSNGISTWGQTVGVTSFDGEYAYLKGDDNGHEANWTFSVVPGTYQVAATWQWAPYNRASNAPFKVSAGAVELPVTVNQTLAPSADQLVEGVAYANGVAFQVLTGNFEVTAGTSTLVVSATDDANSYVILDAVMVRVVSVAPPPSPLGAIGDGASPTVEGHLLAGEDLDPGAHIHDLMATTLGTGVRGLPVSEYDSVAPKYNDLALHVTQFSAELPTAHLRPPAAAQTLPANYSGEVRSAVLATSGDLRRADAVFARLDSWLHRDLDDFLDLPLEDNSDEANEELELWWALYGQE
jgi:hypothetical protein